MHVEIPARLKVRLSGRGSAEIRGVASLHLDEYRGELNVADVAGPITGDLRESRAEFGPGSSSVLITLRVRELNKTVNIVASCREEGNVALLRRSGANEVIVSSADPAKNEI